VGQFSVGINSQLISQRTKDALAPKVGTGVLGNKSNLSEAQVKGNAGNVVASAVFSARVLPMIEKLMVSMSMNAIAARLNEMNVPTMRSGRWTAKAVSRVVASISHCQEKPTTVPRPRAFGKST
jgi:hypothetical protein